MIGYHSLHLQPLRNVSLVICLFLLQFPSLLLLSKYGRSQLGFHVYEVVSIEDVSFHRKPDPLFLACAKSAFPLLPYRELPRKHVKCVRRGSPIRSLNYKKRHYIYIRFTQVSYYLKVLPCTFRCGNLKLSRPFQEDSLHFIR